MKGIIIDNKEASVQFDGMGFYKDDKGYMRCSRSKASGYRRLYLHRYIYEKYISHDIEGFHIHHLDGNPLNNLVCNLVRLTPEQHRAIHFDDDTSMHISQEEWQKRFDESGCQRKIICITTGKEYKSVTEASRDTGETRGQIVYSLQGRRKGIWKRNSERLEWKDAS